MQFWNAHIAGLFVIADYYAGKSETFSNMTGDSDMKRHAVIKSQHQESLAAPCRSASCRAFPAIMPTLPSRVLRTSSQNNSSTVRS